MSANRWLDRTQPQTLFMAVILLYINSVFYLLGVGLLKPVGLLIAAGGVAAGWGIANQKKWGYALGVIMAVLPFIAMLVPGFLGVSFGVGLVNLMFEIALLALLLHPQSREYQRIWFK
jgi:hypothetical protein